MMLTSQGASALRQSAEIPSPVHSFNSHIYNLNHTQNDLYSQRNAYSQQQGAAHENKPILDSSLASHLQASLAVSLNSSLSNPSNHYMQRNLSTNPPIRIQQPLSGSAAPQLLPQEQGFEDGVAGKSAWPQYSNNHRLLPQTAAGYRWGSPARIAGHKRSSSGSTIASTGPSSPFTPVSSSYPQIADSESHSYSSPSGAYETFGKSEPVPATTDFAELFVSPDYRPYPSSQHHAAPQADFQLALRDIMAQQANEIGGAGATLQKTPSGDFPDEFKLSMESRNGVPKLDRTMSDIYQDELYNPNMAMPAPSVQVPQRTSDNQDRHLSPRRDVFSERLQAANNGHMSARSSSPAGHISRDRSPFRPTSEYANEEFPTSHSSSPGPRLGSAAELRERQKAQTDAQAFARHHHQPSALQNTRTISPKEALLDIREHDEETMSPLFGAESAQRQPHPAENDFASGNSGSDLANAFKDNTEVRTTSLASPNADSSAHQQGNPRRQRPNPQMPQQYPFISQPRRQNSSFQSNVEPIPEFPAHLTSMESTRSDTRSSEPNSDGSDGIRRPPSTTADSGTYSCTYHGCTMRFETPVKLQRHKRDGHRQDPPPSAIGGDSISNRNSQAGPHKCERINPSTGKPCNSIFSRPYDLTRHEDTIHNARKQKVKCQFCTEEKTFSRNDALTRHMRVVHPEVDFPGKMKRKG